MTEENKNARRKKTQYTPKEAKDIEAKDSVKMLKKQEAELKKKILAEEKDKLENAAKKIALKTMTEMQLATQVELSEEQKTAAKMRGEGKTYDEIANSLGKKRQEVIAWASQPSFSRAVNEATLKEGLSDKNERVRKAKRIAESINDAILTKIENGDLDNVSMSTLSQLALQWSQRVDALVDKKDEGIDKKDLTVLILNHVQESSSKKYNSLDDFLTDPQFMYPTIDTEVIDITNDNN
jgi:hypothetical protein